MPQLDVNTDDLNGYSKKLGMLHRSAFPNAVRGTLNSAAFDVKKTTLPASAAKTFIQRQPNFFKANSRVKQASGWNVSSMKATIGMVSLKGTNKAVDDLEQQEHGGVIRGRSFIPIRTARIGGSHSKNVKKQNRISGINNIVTARQARGKSRGQRFIKSVIYAGVGGYVLSEAGILWRVNALNKNRRGGMKLTALHSFKKKRSVKVDATHFMENAAEKTAKKIPGFYKKEAERQFKKYLGK